MIPTPHPDQAAANAAARWASFRAGWCERTGTVCRWVERGARWCRIEAETRSVSWRAEEQRNDELASRPSGPPRSIR